MEETRKELAKIEPTKATIKIHGKEREIKFGFSAWAKIEKEYHGLKNLPKMQKELEENPFSVIPHLLFIGLTDKSAYTDEKGNTYPEVTEENILDEYGLGDIQYVTEIFSKALYGSLPQDEEKKTK